VLSPRVFALCFAFLVGSLAFGQVTYPGLGKYYTDLTPLRVLGWSKDEAYFVFDSGQSGDGGAGMETRFIARTRDGRIVMRFSEGDAAASQVPLERQSAAYLRKLGVKGKPIGRLVFNYTKDLFPNGKMPRVAQLATGVQVAGGKLRLVNNFKRGKVVKNPEGIAAFSPAEYRLDLVKGATTRTIGLGVAGSDLMFGIERVYVSPSGKNLAVILVRYRGGFFEGWNVAAEHALITARLK
jgi:hypothetical protein